MSRYSERYRTSSPKYPNPSPITLERLLAAWEKLRELDTHGYRTSSAVPPSTWLAKIAWADGHSCGPSVGRGTTCSPFVTQATAMAYSKDDSGVYKPVLSDGSPLPMIFSHAANGALRPERRQHQEMMERFGMTRADNEWPRPIIHFNMGYAVELEQMRRGDAVHIDWMSGGGHAVFCWDVHLNDRGEVDAFLYVSANGSMANGGSGGGISVGGTSRGAGGLLATRPGSGNGEPPEYYAVKTPLFVDDERYVVEGAWVTWDDEVAGKLLTDMRARPKTKVKKAKRVLAARFHGVDVTKIPFYAMGQDTPGPWTPPPAPAVPEVVTKSAASSAEEAKALQRRLKLLFLIGWIKADPGQIDGKPGKKTTAAVVAFQRAYGLKQDGKIGPLTSAKLESVFRSAFDAPEAKQYLDPTQASGLTFADTPWEESAALYFRHGSVSAGQSVELILYGEELPQRPLRFDLIDEESSKSVLDGDCVLQPIGNRGSATINVPQRAAGRMLTARLIDVSLETPAPLHVVPMHHSAV